MQKLIIISGPTASGKTSLALQIAQKYNGEIISADSRQIYKGMDIGTGKDHPKNIKIHLIDIIAPNQSFSVSEYRRLALKTISEIQNSGKLPIIVGGTGQYIDGIIRSRETYHVKPNWFVRSIFNHLPLKMLQATLRFLDFQTFDSLNNSDLHNPHRLIRKIEIAINGLSPLHNMNHVPGFSFPVSSFLHLSLTASNDILYKRIDDRVDTRLKSGLLEEIKELLKKYTWNHPGLNTLAYKEFQPYFHESCFMNLESCIFKWRFHEHAYMRRQKTWFKKIPNINFLDITDPSYQSNALSLIDNFLDKS